MQFATTQAARNTNEASEKWFRVQELYFRRLGNPPQRSIAPGKTSEFGNHIAMGERIGILLAVLNQAVP